MKLISGILLFSFLLIGVTPFALIPIMGSECIEMCCATDVQEDCERTGTEECLPGMCSPGQCCFCYFFGIANGKKLEIIVYNTSFKNIPANGLVPVTDYCTDCWQPPERNYFL